MIKAILFDMDGTLLPMDIDLFIKTYMGGLGKNVASLGMDPKPVLGIPVFQVTDCLLNQHNLDISAFPQGSWDDCVQFINKFVPPLAEN